MERKCGECGFYRPDIFVDNMGSCTISGNPHSPTDICEAEKGGMKDGSIQSKSK